MAWEQRLSVSIGVATVLRSLEKEDDLPLYLDVNPYRVLFDKVHPPLPHSRFAR